MLRDHKNLDLKYYCVFIIIDTSHNMWCYRLAEEEERKKEGNKEYKHFWISAVSGWPEKFLDYFSARLIKAAYKL